MLVGWATSELLACQLLLLFEGCCLWAGHVSAESGLLAGWLLLLLEGCCLWAWHVSAESAAV